MSSRAVQVTTRTGDETVCREVLIHAFLDGSVLLKKKTRNGNIRKNEEAEKLANAKSGQYTNEKILKEY